MRGCALTKSLFGVFGNVPDGQARHDTTPMIAMQSLYARMVP
jgi:hypothetical protein